ncbi:MAG: N-acetylmuramidase family protein [Nitrososphaera sp.]
MTDRYTLEFSEFAAAAKRLRCRVPLIQAVAEVESAGSGFLNNGKVRVLFEGHQFWRYTGGHYARSHPTLCHKKWTSENYSKGKTADIRGAGELVRLTLAMELDQVAALMSASYGLFQVMGFNFALCGYTSVETFYENMCFSADRQLYAFCEYIKSTGLDDEIRNEMWDDFAYKYNGPGYLKNRYAEKLRKAVIRFDQ